MNGDAVWKATRRARIPYLCQREALWRLLSVLWRFSFFCVLVFLSFGFALDVRNLLIRFFFAYLLY